MARSCHPYHLAALRPGRGIAHRKGLSLETAWRGATPLQPAWSDVSRMRDSVVRHAETWLAENFREPHAVAAAVAACGIPERSLKRRFKAATGTTLISYVQNLRIEDAKQLLERAEKPFDDIALGIGYENTAFFRRLFKRCTGLTPGQY